MKEGDVLIVRNLSEIQSSGGNTSDMVEGEEVLVTHVGHYIRTHDTRYGSFSIKKDENGLNWETFFTRKFEK